MKKIFLVCLLVLSFLVCTTVFAGNNVTQGNSGITGKKSYEVLNPEGYEGYWAEKADGPMVMTVTPADESEWYDVSVTLRRALPKKDLYMMRAHYQNDGSLYYENGLYVIRHSKKNGNVKDKVKYKNGSGLLYYSFDENVLYWTDYTLPPEKNVRIFLKTSAPEPEKNKETD